MLGYVKFVLHPKKGNGMFFCRCSKIIKRILLAIILGCCLATGGFILLSIRAGLGAGYLMDSLKMLNKTFLLRRFGPHTIAMKELLGTYLRLTTQALFTQPDTLHNEHILDYDVYFYDYANLKLLFLEIFGNEEYYFKAATDKPFIIDCGANIGMATLYFKMLYPCAEILAFEPARLCCGVLQKNITSNHLDKVSIINKALSDHEGTVELLDASGGKGNLCATMLFDKNGQKKAHFAPVECTQLSSYITKPVDLLKIDIEGAERVVLEDLKKNKKLSFIKEIVLEYHHHFLGGNSVDALGAFLATLEQHNFGYQIMGCSPQIGYQFELHGSQMLIIHAYQKVPAAA
jgi:FkbM family methyltransferase